MSVSRVELEKLSYPHKPRTKEEKKENRKKYNKEHEKEIKEYNKNHYKENKEKIKERVGAYNEKHREEKNEYSKNYYEENKEEIKKRFKRYNEEHKNEKKEYNKTYLKKGFYLGAFGEEGFSLELFQEINKIGKVLGIGRLSVRTPKENKISRQRFKLKDVTALNEYFEGSELHHLTKDVVAFIPKELHRSIWHNLKTGKNMDLINRAALKFVKEQEL